MSSWLNKISELVSTLCGGKEPNKDNRERANTNNEPDLTIDLTNLSSSHRDLINRVNTIETILSNSTSPASNRNGYNRYL